MTRVPIFLPLRTKTLVQHGNGMLNEKWEERAVWMEFVMYPSPALVHGLLMTEILAADNETVERFFFGYRCTVCETVYFVLSHVRNEQNLWECLRHKCETSALRRAARNAREMGLERDEYIMEGFRGKWWCEYRRMQDNPR